MRSVTAVALSVALLCSLATSLNLLYGKRFFSDEYIYTLAAIGQFPGEPFTDQPAKPSPAAFWSSNGIQQVRTTGYIESSNMFLYELLLFLVIGLTGSTDSMTIGLLSLLPTWIGALVLYRIVLYLSRDRLRGLAAATLFLVHPQIFYRGVDFRGYALAMMFTLLALYPTVIAIVSKHTMGWQATLFVLSATGAFFSHYTTTPFLIVCWVAMFVVTKGSRGRLIVCLLAWCILIAVWMHLGAFSAIQRTNERVARQIAETIQTTPNNFVVLTARNFLLAVSEVVRTFVGLSLFAGFRYRYQAITIVLGIACFAAWLRFVLGGAGKRTPVGIFSLLYVAIPFAWASLLTLSGGHVLPLRASYQLWSIPLIIVMFLELLWFLQRERLRFTIFLIVLASLTATVVSYNGSKKNNPYDPMLARIRAGDVAEITVPRYYHAQFLFFHGGRRQQTWPTVNVDCRDCRKDVRHPAWPVWRFDDEVADSYIHRRFIVLSLIDGRKIEIEEPLLFERAF